MGYLETLTLKDEWLTAGERAVITIALRQGNKVRHRSSCLRLARLEHGGIKPQRERFATKLISDVMKKFELLPPPREVNLLLMSGTAAAD